MNKSWLVSTFLVAAMTSPAIADDMSGTHNQGQHEHGATPDHQTGHDHGDAQMPMSGEDVFLIKKDIDGYQVSFHVMKARPGKEMGGTHDFMIKVERGGKLADVVSVNSKVKQPDGQEESKMMMTMGDWYMAGYDLTHEGEHQLMVLFKTADGLKHFGGVYYPMHME